MMRVCKVESLDMAKVMPDSTSSSRLSKGRRTLGIMSIAFRLERYTVARMRVSSSHSPASTLAEFPRGSHGTPVIFLLHLWH